MLRRTNAIGVLVMVAACLTVGFLARPPGPAEEKSTRAVEPEVIAQVGGVAIRADDIGLDPFEPPDEEARRLLARAVERSLLASAARREGLSDDPEVRTRIEEILAVHYLYERILPDLLSVEVSTAANREAARVHATGALDGMAERNRRLVAAREARRDAILRALRSRIGLWIAPHWVLPSPASSGCGTAPLPCEGAGDHGAEHDPPSPRTRTSQVTNANEATD